MVKYLMDNYETKNKDDQIRNLEQEIERQKKIINELQQKNTIFINNEQVQNFLDELTERMEYSTDKIINGMPKERAVYSTKDQSNDGLSFVIKLIIGLTFIAAALLIGYSLYKIWGEIWSGNWLNKIILIIFAVIPFDCIYLGVEIIREKDRNYIISLFSSLIALVALIFAIIK